MIAVFRNIVPGILAISDFSSSVNAIGWGTPGASVGIAGTTGGEYAGGGGLDGLEDDRVCTDFHREKDEPEGWVPDEVARARPVGAVFSGLSYSSIVAGGSAEGREMISGVMCVVVPRLLTCELRRVNACRRLTVRDRRGSITGDGRGRNTGMHTSASESSV